MDKSTIYMSNRTNMDFMTDILQQAGLRRRLLDMRALAPGLALQFPCEKSLGLHVVTKGRAYVFAPNQVPMALSTGDIALMARGCTHFVSTSASMDNLPRVVITLAQAGNALAVSTGGAADNVVVSGAYQLWHDPVHPLFALLPAWYVLRAETVAASTPLKQAIGLLEQEMRERSLGADMIVHGLLDVIFTYALRQMVDDTAPKQSNWASGIREASVRQAVQLMHDDCGRAWTLGDLASAVGVSRTGLAAKFRDAMGDTPLNYLRTVRIQNAMRILSKTQKTLETVATEVGYQDAFSFSKVFKRTVGVSPREFRQRDTIDQSAEWRFDGAA
jgi:AraC-like DNA-binding protein